MTQKYFNYLKIYFIHTFINIFVPQLSLPTTNIDYHRPIVTINDNYSLSITCIYHCWPPLPTTFNSQLSKIDNFQ